MNHLIISFIKSLVLGVLLLLCLLNSAFAQYAWPIAKDSTDTLSSRVKVPAGFKRISVKPGSYAAWLRGLPMKPASTPVRLHTGNLKWNQFAHLHVVDIDIGKRDLQQCADAVMRLRAEYLYATKRYKHIAFNYTNGKRVRYTSWTRSRDYKRFKKYMIQIFSYAGTYSLSKELKRVSISDMQIGDVFIQGGFPGHAVLVADMIENKETGEKRFLLLQSFMPAQNIHVLRNPLNPGSPWYSDKVGKTLRTPEWTFKNVKLKRFSPSF